MTPPRKPHSGWVDDRPGYGAALYLAKNEQPVAEILRESVGSDSCLCWSHYGRERRWKTSTLDSIKLEVEDRLHAHYLRMATLLRPSDGS